MRIGLLGIASQTSRPLSSGAGVPQDLGRPGFSMSKIEPALNNRIRWLRDRDREVAATNVLVGGDSVIGALEKTETWPRPRDGSLIR